MSDSAPVPKVGEARIGKQIMLPWSKAIEIAAKSIRVRFWRSMITMSSVVLAIAFLMYIWTSTAILAALAVGPPRAVDAVKERLDVVRAAALADRIAVVMDAPDRPGVDGYGEDMMALLGAELPKALQAAEESIKAKTLEMNQAAGQKHLELRKEVKEIESALKSASKRPVLLWYLRRERSRYPRVPADETGGDVTRRYARDLAAAVRRQRRAIADKTSAMASAGSEEAKKLQKEIDELEAELAPANTVPFLENYLLTRRRELERQQGELNRLLQQDRAGQEQATGPGGAEPPQAPVRGVVTDFLAAMSPADKWLAILALLVCFVGIANAMFMTVQERFREIGTMKCLGALDLFIVKIFLLESAALGLIGTLLGIGVGLLLAFLNHLRLYGGPAFTYFPMGNILVAAIFATLIGLILSVLAAIFPARKAARMEPVEAMRAEE